MDQPLAWLVVNGHKNIEGRSWPTKLRGKVLIKASSHRVTAAEYDLFIENCQELKITRYPTISSFAVGGIIGSVEIVDCVKQPQTSFFKSYVLIVANAKKIPFLPGRFKTDWIS